MQGNEHRISWWAYAWGYDGNVERLPRQPYMKAREGWRAWEATCSCGWQTRTGGALASWIQKEIRWHKWEVEFDDAESA